MLTDSDELAADHLSFFGARHSTSRGSVSAAVDAAAVAEALANDGQALIGPEQTRSLTLPTGSSMMDDADATATGSGGGGGGGGGVGISMPQPIRPVSKQWTFPAAAAAAVGGGDESWRTPCASPTAADAGSGSGSGHRSIEGSPSDGDPNSSTPPTPPFPKRVLSFSPSTPAASKHINTTASTATATASPSVNPIPNTNTITTTTINHITTTTATATATAPHYLLVPHPPLTGSISHPFIGSKLSSPQVGPIAAAAEDKENAHPNQTVNHSTTGLGTFPIAASKSKSLLPATNAGGGLPLHPAHPMHRTIGLTGRSPLTELVHTNEPNNASTTGPGNAASQPGATSVPLATRSLTVNRSPLALSSHATTVKAANGSTEPDHSPAQVQPPHSAHRRARTALAVNASFGTRSPSVAPCIGGAHFESPVYSRFHVELNRGASVIEAKVKAAAAGGNSTAMTASSTEPMQVVVPSPVKPNQPLVVTISAAEPVSVSGTDTVMEPATAPLPAGSHLAVTIPAASFGGGGESVSADLPSLSPVSANAIDSSAAGGGGSSRRTRRIARPRTQSVSSQLLSQLQTSDDESAVLAAFAESEIVSLQRTNSLPVAYHRPAPSEPASAAAATSEPQQPLSAGTPPSDAESGISPTHAPGGILPALAGDKSYGIKRISPDTVSRLVRGEYSAHFDRWIIIDARYDYEYSGGHITGAINVNSRLKLADFYKTSTDEAIAAAAVAAVTAAVGEAKIAADNESAAAASSPNADGAPTPPTGGVSPRIAVIFHCEFSQNRGPKSCAFFRQLDRQCNEALYPHLTFPELAVMDGGYKRFFEQHPDLCTPRAYVSMWDPAHAEACKQRTRDFRLLWAEDVITGTAVKRAQGTFTAEEAAKLSSGGGGGSMCGRRGSLGGPLQPLNGRGEGGHRRSRTMRIRDISANNDAARSRVAAAAAASASAATAAGDGNLSSPPKRKPALLLSFSDTTNGRSNTGSAGGGGGGGAKVSSEQQSEINRARLRGALHSSGGPVPSGTGTGTGTGAANSGLSHPQRTALAGGAHHERRHTFNSSRISELRLLPDLMPSPEPPSQPLPFAIPEFGAVNGSGGSAVSTGSGGAASSFHVVVTSPPHPTGGGAADGVMCTPAPNGTPSDGKGGMGSTPMGGSPLPASHDSPAIVAALSFSPALHSPQVSLPSDVSDSPAPKPVASGATN